MLSARCIVCIALGEFKDETVVVIDHVGVGLLHLHVAIDQVVLNDVVSDRLMHRCVALHRGKIRIMQEQMVIDMTFLTIIFLILTVQLPTRFNVQLFIWHKLLGLVVLQVGHEVAHRCIISWIMAIDLLSTRVSFILNHGIIDLVLIRSLLNKLEV